MLWPDDDTGAGGTPSKVEPVVTPPKTNEPPKVVVDPAAAVVAAQQEAAVVEKARLEGELKTAKKQLEEESKARKALEEANATRERARLEEEGRYKELAEQEKQRADQARADSVNVVRQAQDLVITAELKSALVMAGVKDTDVHVLVDKSKIVVEEDGKIQGIAEAVESFKTAKPGLFGEVRSGVTTSIDPRVPGAPAPGARPGYNPIPKENYKQERDKFLRSLAGGKK